MKTKIKGWKNKTAFVLPALRGLLVTALGFLVSNATVLGSFSPFGISLAIAVPLPGLPFAMVGSLAGYLVFGGVVRNGAYLGCLLVASAARFALSTRLKDSKRLLLINSVMVGITLAGLHIIAYLIQPVGMITFLLWIAESALCGCVCYMVGVVSVSYTHLCWGRRRDRALYPLPGCKTVQRTLEGFPSF